MFVSLKINMNEIEIKMRELALLVASALLLAGSLLLVGCCLLARARLRPLVLGHTASHAYIAVVGLGLACTCAQFHLPRNTTRHRCRLAVS